MLAKKKRPPNVGKLERVTQMEMDEITKIYNQRKKTKKSAIDWDYFLDVICPVLLFLSFFACIWYLLHWSTSL